MSTTKTAAELEKELEDENSELFVENQRLFADKEQAEAREKVLIKGIKDAIGILEQAIKEAAN